MESTIPGLRELHSTLLQAAPLHEDLSAYATLLTPCLLGEQSQVSDSWKAVAGDGQVWSATLICSRAKSRKDFDFSLGWIVNNEKSMTDLQFSWKHLRQFSAKNLCHHRSRKSCCAPADNHGGDHEIMRVLDHLTSTIPSVAFQAVVGLATAGFSFLPEPKKSETFGLDPEWEILKPKVPGATPPECGEDVPTPWDTKDVTLLKLSLIQILVVKSDNLCIDPHVRGQYSCVLELLQKTEAHAKIIGLLNTSDKVLSHISSKCLSHLVLFQLKCQNEVNACWLQFCLNSLCLDPGSQPLVPCLMSLLSVCKGILIEERLQNAELLKKVLVPLENVFEVFCSTFFTYLSKSSCQQTAPIREANIQLTCLLDVIEALVALRIQLKCNATLCKQVFSAILPQALNIISSAAPYFVKKQFLLVLKRCLLHKALEDFLPSARVVSHQQDEALDKDMDFLAKMLLVAVQQGWLLQVPVSDRVHSFGGVNEGSEPGKDLVTLGAVCLSVVKALEIQLNHGAFGPAHNLDLETLMAHLLEFLKHHIIWKEPVHPCEWVSMIFIQQDDDMLEAAKCLLKMYQHNPSTFSASDLFDRSIWSDPSHLCGCNPHCIFLFLLSNVVFDSSVLLDFLISSETCFLEYFVRYLKLLKGDWPQFCLICTSFDKSANVKSPTVATVSDCPQPGESAIAAPSDCISLSNRLSPTPMDIGSPASSSVKSNAEYSTVSVTAGSLGALQRLVDYDSSEESEPEIGSSQHCLVSGHLAGADSTDIDKHMGTLKLKARRAQILANQPNAQPGGIAKPGIQQRAVQCLQNLRESIDRLHKKKLFPYNPSALLRLLSSVGNLAAEK
ncbi:protein Lines homolog 1 [Gastrophryne carolinensis]